MLALILATAFQSAPPDRDRLIAKVAEQATRDAQLRYERGVAGDKWQETRDDDKPPRIEQWRLQSTPEGILEQRTFTDGRPIIGAKAEHPKFETLLAMIGRYKLRMASPEPVEGCYLVA